MLLDATSVYNNYLWQDSSFSETFLFNDTALGNYNLNVSAIDTNGCKNSDSINVTVEICEGIESIFQSEINIFPSPANNNLTIEMLIGISPEQIIITDVLGKEVLHFESQKIKTQLDVSSLSIGIYLLKIKMQNGESVVRKFIKK